MDRDPRGANLIEPLDARAPEIGRWLWAIEDTRRRTKRVLEGLTQPIVDWVDPRGGNAIGTLLYHVAAIEIDWLHADVLEGEPWPPEMEALFPHDVRDARGALTAVHGAGLDEHLRRLDAVRARLIGAFRGLSIDDFRRVRRMTGYDVTPEWVLHHLMQHEAEHRGQIGDIRLRAESAAKIIHEQHETNTNRPS